MYINRPQHLGKTVSVTATNRPIKIAYLVPYTDSPVTHAILDAAFYESYTRWGGAYTLLIPTDTDRFLKPDYEPWLEFFDPDFIYTYVTLDDNFVKRIDRLCSPIAFLSRRERDESDDIHWRGFLPSWNHYFSAVSSVTTVPSPHLHSSLGRHVPETDVLVITQYEPRREDRFVRDNFGVAFNTIMATNPVPGLYKTLSLVEPELPPHMNVGTVRCNSIGELFDAFAAEKTIAIAKLARVHSEGISKAKSLEWSDSFNLFIGGSVLDRLNFWNARHFTPTHSGTLGAMIVGIDFFDDDDWVKQLGHYLNAHNYSQGGGPAVVTIRSLSLGLEELIRAREKLQPHTHNSVQLENSCNAHAHPLPNELNNVFDGACDSTTFKVAEDRNTVLAKEPDHIAFIPARYRDIAIGNWVVTHEIERHNNLSQYSNVVDRWVLPKRQKLARAFTNALGKVSRRGCLSLIPAAPGLLFGQAGNVKYTYDLHLPDDETFFQHLLTRFSEYPEPDRRAGTDHSGYEDISISDKGENLRGIISMFESLSDAYKILTNKYWRGVLRSAKDKSVRYLTYNLHQLLSRLPNDKASRQKLNADLRFDNIVEVTKFMEANVIDTLEFLIKQNVFFQVHTWRCEYCGHSNFRNFDDMKIKNFCNICSRDYFVPVDMEWVYQLNEFVYRTLVNGHALPVLWALGFIQEHIAMGNFWFLPEVDLYESRQPIAKKEIDILCIADGKFYAIEVKLTASQFQASGEIDKFIDKINRIQPDVAMLVFERYAKNEEAAPAILDFLTTSEAEIREAIGPSIKLQVLTAEDIADFKEHPHYVGPSGIRTRTFY
ncbi:MAG: hypothetical protein EOO52_08555 [Gammaproteobacteria bacterium]|nr:MAG: hypothetical protein EOO52_08555 [Gammaproteobacteria bacterium]